MPCRFQQLYYSTRLTKIPENRTKSTFCPSKRQFARPTSLTRASPRFAAKRLQDMGTPSSARQWQFLQLGGEDRSGAQILTRVPENRVKAQTCAPEVVQARMSVIRCAPSTISAAQHSGEAIAGLGQTVSSAPMALFPFGGEKQSDTQILAKIPENRVKAQTCAPNVVQARMSVIRHPPPTISAA